MTTLPPAAARGSTRFAPPGVERGARWIERADATRVRWAVAGLIVLPFVVAAIVLRGREWHPVLDLAMTELRVRDVGGAQSPLIGLPGRIGVFPDQGSHPGPASFYLLTPVYRALGSSAWALLVSTMVLNAIAVVGALVIAQRRGGTRMVLAVGALLVLLVRGYGWTVVTQPWNPYLPLLAWVVVVLATWSVVLGDHRLVVVVAGAGSFCAQTHLPYLGLWLGMLALCVVRIVHTWWRHPVRRNDMQRWLGTATVVIALMWAPVLWDELRREPGNLSMLREYFGNPPEDPAGFGEGVRLVLRHLDPFRLAGGALRGEGYFVRAGFRLDGSTVPGVLLVLAFAASCAAAWRMRHRLVLGLQLVVGWSLVLATISMSRIFGKVWFYLTLWMWVTTTLMIVCVVWTAALVAQDRWASWRATASGWRATPPRLAAVLLATAVAVASWAGLVVAAFGAEAPEQHLSDSLRALVGPTEEAIRSGAGAAAGAGADGRYVVTWQDALWFGSQGYGLVNELEREGLDVGVRETWRVPVTRHRVIPPGEATAEILLATGSYIDAMRALPGAVEVAFHEPRDAGELARYAELEAELRTGLRDRGLPDVEAMVSTNLFGVQLDERVPRHLQSVVDRMLRLGQPEAVFVVPAGTSP